MLSAVDARLFYLINRSFTNPFLDRLMPLVSALGSGEGVFVVALLVILFNLKKREKRIAGVVLLAGLTLGFYIIFPLKNWIARPRPFMTLTGVHLIERARDFSFPSGHAATAFMAAAILSGFFKRYSVLFYLLAVAIAFSRVYMGVHYVSDVVAGALLGSAIGYALVKVSKG